MMNDPNGMRWSNSEKNYGKALLKKSGWTEGSGIGKDGEGTASHVKVVRKDDTMGLGYKAGVQEAWSAQSVGFADVLERIKSSNASPIIDSDDDVGDDSSSHVTGSPTSPNATHKISESRHFKMYAKRNALKTELVRLQDGEKREEILGSAASSKRTRDDVHVDAKPKRRRKGEEEDSDDEDASTTACTLVSPLLTRLMVRCPKDEPKPTTKSDGTVERVVIAKPHPRPAKCTDSPFLAQE